MTNDIEAVEGDPNGLPWRTRPGAPTLEWVHVSELQPGDQVMQGMKYVHTVEVSEAAEHDRWKLVIVDPWVAPTSGPTWAEYEKLSSRMPRRRELVMQPDMPYRRLVS